MNYRTYKYLLKPTSIQKKYIDEILALTMFLRKKYEEDLSANIDLPYLVKDKLTYYQNKYIKLQNIDKSALYNEIFYIDNRNTNRPRPSNSYTTSLSTTIKHSNIKNNKIYLPYIGEVKFINSRTIDISIKIRSYTIQKCLDKYYIYIDVTLPEQPKKALNLNNSIAFDYSSTHFLIDDKGNSYDIPKFYRSNKNALSDLQRKRSCLKTNSIGSEKLKNKIKKKHRKIANRRKDYLQKLSTEIANTYDYVFIESLEMKEIAHSYNLSTATLDNSYYAFTKMLEYKLSERNKKLIKVSKYFPSSKRCNVCGNINNELKLKDKVWVCPYCGSLLNRDVNAALNIREEGKRISIAVG